MVEIRKEKYMCLNYKVKNNTQLIIGLISLIIGFIFYFSFRANTSSYFQIKLKTLDVLFGHYPRLFHNVGGALPSFIHPFAFSLIAMGLISGDKKSRGLICILFFLINFFFELGQKYNGFIIKYIPYWFNKFFVLENIKIFFNKGIFSVYDLIAIMFGAIAAFLIGQITT